MLLGFALRELLDTCKVRDYPKKLPLILFFLSFFTYLVLKVIKCSAPLSPVLHLCLGMAVLLSSFSALWAGYDYNEGISSCFMEKNPNIGNILHYIGSLALPIYLVQCFNAGNLGYTLGLRVRFPLSFALNLIIVWGTAAFVSECFKEK